MSRYRQQAQRWNRKARKCELRARKAYDRNDRVNGDGWLRIAVIDRSYAQMLNRWAKEESSG